MDLMLFNGFRACIRILGNGEDVGNYHISEKQVDKNMEHAMET